MYIITRIFIIWANKICENAPTGMKLFWPQSNFREWKPCIFKNTRICIYLYISCVFVSLCLHCCAIKNLLTPKWSSMFHGIFDAIQRPQQQYTPKCWCVKLIYISTAKYRCMWVNAYVSSCYTYNNNNNCVCSTACVRWQNVYDPSSCLLSGFQPLDLIAVPPNICVVLIWCICCFKKLNYGVMNYVNNLQTTAK